MSVSSHCFKTTALTMLVVGWLTWVDQAFAQECNISLSNSSVDFGQVIQPGPSDALNSGNMHGLGYRAISVNVVCPEASKMALSFRGEQLGGKFKFAKQGNILINLSNALMDGRRVDLAQVKTPGAVPEAFAASVEVVPGEMVIPISGGIPVEGAVLSVQVEVRPLMPVVELKTRDKTTLEANLSVEVKGY